MLLEMSHFYQVPNGRKHAIAKLEVRRDFSPALQLYCARQWHIAAWVEPAVKGLLASPIEDITFDEARVLGLDVFLFIVQTQARIERHRRKCALYPPVQPIHDIGCVARSKCEASWRQAWWGEHDRAGVAKGLLHPVKPMSAREVVAKLDHLQTDWMMPECVELTLAALQGTEEKPGVFFLEEKLLRDAIAELAVGAESD